MRRTKEDAQKTREDILNEAVRIFSEQGVAKTSLEEIAKAACVTRGAIYWHFKNKAGIFDALYERLYQPLTEMILQDIEKDHPEPLRQLQDLCIKLLQDLESNIQKRQAITIFMIKCNYSGNMTAYKEKHRVKKEESLKLFSSYFIKARKKGMLSPDADPLMLTLSIRCYIKGIIVEYLDDPDHFKIGLWAPKLIEQFFKRL